MADQNNIIHHYHNLSNNNQGALYLVITSIGSQLTVNQKAKAVLEQVDVIFCEHTKRAIRLCQSLKINKPVLVYEKFSEQKQTQKILARLQKKQKVALISDAGYPLICDPGAIVTQAALVHDFNVIPVGGASPALLTLIASGFLQGSYLFVGFLPAKTHARKKALLQYDDFKIPLIFYEAPHRLLAFLITASQLYPNHQACIAKELTKKHEQFFWGTLKELAFYFANQSIKGEYVIIIKNTSKAQVTLSDAQILEQLEKLLKQGINKSEAVKTVASNYHLNKQKLYLILKAAGYL